MERLEHLLKRTMGLDAESIGSRSIHRAVLLRQKACGLASTEEYLKLAGASEAELQELIEAIVVPETWFFRDPEAFVALAKLATQQWPGRPSGGVLRVLSLPCSSGEEPYSIAMTLLDAGLPDGGFRVDAVDISERALALARKAVYGRNSFRGRELAFRDKYFTPEKHQFSLRPLVLKSVSFHRGNLLADDYMPGAGLYDAIFCRNLLIYFDEPTQQRALRMLDRLLTPAGWLFTGPSEAPLLVRHGLVSLKLPLAFAFRKQGPADAMVPARKIGRSPASPAAPAGSSVARPRRDPLPAPPARATSSRPAVKEAAPPTAGAMLDEAALLADQGRLGDAGRLCEMQLRQHGPSARAYFIMGLVNDAADRPKLAEQYYRKALYLEPAHHETLVHLALLLERAGDLAGARVLHGRAQRTREQLKPAARH